MNKLFKNFEEILCGGFLIIMISVVIANVFMRYFLDSSIVWAEEVATICFVWAVFIGASATYKNKLDVGINALVEKTSPHIKKIIYKIVALLMLIINGYIFYISIVFTSISYQKPMSVLGVSSAVINSSLIVGFGLMTLHSIRFLKQEFKGATS